MWFIQEMLKSVVSNCAVGGPDRRIISKSIYIVLPSETSYFMQFC